MTASPINSLLHNYWPGGDHPDDIGEFKYSMTNVWAHAHTHAHTRCPEATLMNDYYVTPTSLLYTFKLSCYENIKVTVIH